MDTFREIHRNHRGAGKIVRMLVVSAVAASIAIILFVWLNPADKTPANSETTPIAQIPGEISPAEINDDTAPAVPNVQPSQDAKPESPPAKQAPSTSPLKDRPASKVQWDQYVVYKNGIQILGDDTALGEARALMDEGKRKEALPLLEKYFSTLTPEEEDFDLRLEVGKIYLKEEKKLRQGSISF